MNFRTLGLLAAFAIAAWTLPARSQSPEAGAPATAPKVDLQLAGTSVPATAAPAMLEEPEDLLRDPFWPVDYVRPVAEPAGPVVPAPGGDTGAKPEPPKPSENWEQAQKAISIKGIIRSGNRYLANINNQLVGETETVSVFFQGQKYVWKVTTITAKKVLFQPSEILPMGGEGGSTAMGPGPMMGP